MNDIEYSNVIFGDHTNERPHRLDFETAKRKKTEPANDSQLFV